MKIAHHNRTNHGFTLIEILVVISIIGILSGMLFTGASAAMKAAKKADAGNTAYNVRNAAAAYFTEYRRHPKPDGISGTEYADFETDEAFMDILMGADSTAGKARNPRGIAFFSGKAAKPFKEGTYIKGVAFNASGGGSLWDPFGRMYGVRLDTSNKGRMPNPEVTQPTGWGTTGNTDSFSAIITEPVAVWSAGPDPDKASDNVKTW